MGPALKRDHRQSGLTTVFGRLTRALLIALLPLVLAVSPAVAADKMTGNEISVAAGRQIRGDLFVLGRHVDIAGTVHGDLIGAADSMAISGTVNGSVNLVARTVSISGLVTGSAHLAAGKVTIAGTISGDLLVTARRIAVAANGRIGGDLILGNGDLVVAGSVGHQIRGSADDVTFKGTVGGPVRVSADHVRVANQARIGGDLRYASGHVATVAAGSMIAGEVIRTRLRRFSRGADVWWVLTSPLTRLLMSLVAGLLLLFLMPRPLVTAADTTRHHFLGSVLAGVVCLIVWPLLVVALVAFVVGIPLAVIGTALMLSLAWLSQVLVGTAIGRTIMPKKWKIESRGYNILAMAVGSTLLGAVRMAPVPFISPAAGLAVAVLGVGGAMYALRGQPDPWAL